MYIQFHLCISVHVHTFEFIFYITTMKQAIWLVNTLQDLTMLHGKFLIHYNYFIRQLYYKMRYALCDVTQHLEIKHKTL